MRLNGGSAGEAFLGLQVGEARIGPQMRHDGIDRLA